MKRWSQYRAVLLPTVLLTLLMLGFAWYATGVVDRDRAMEQAENRLVQMSQKIDALQSEQSLILDEAQADYQTRARIISMMINTTPTLLETETDLEELRLVAGAEVISVSDLQGVIRFSTDQSRTGDRVEDAFLPAITNKVFSEWYFPDESTRDILLVGTARLDQDGVIQITFKPDDISQLMQSADLSELVSGTQFMENGTLSVLDESCRYMSHTDSALVGAQSPYAPADFPAMRDTSAQAHTSPPLWYVTGSTAVTLWYVPCRTGRFMPAGTVRHCGCLHWAHCWISLPDSALPAGCTGISNKQRQCRIVFAALPFFFTF